MTYNPKLLPSRLELARRVMQYFDTKAVAKETNSPDDWAEHFRIARELREEARSIIYAEEE